MLHNQVLSKFCSFLNPFLCDAAIHAGMFRHFMSAFVLSGWIRRYTIGLEKLLLQGALLTLIASMISENVYVRLQ